MCAAGVTSLILEKDFFVSSHPVLKIPFYGLMGVAISFSITFSFCDIINYILLNFMSKFSKPIIDT